MSRGFSFKQFTVKQKNAAFKVGTDSVILGAWADILNARNILDIGTGTGLLSLMCAQRNVAANIVAIEKDPLSVQDAHINFSESRWAARLCVENVSLENFTGDLKFDYIICNPPYFLNALQSDNKRKMDTRHATIDWFSTLAHQINLLSSEQGLFGSVLPEAAFVALERNLNLQGWAVVRKQRVLAYPDADKVRVLAEWRRGQEKPNILPDFFVRNASHEFDSEYVRLTQDFYLKF